MIRRRRVMFAFLWAIIVVVIGLSWQLYRVLSAPPPDCYCWNYRGYWFNPESHGGTFTADADGARHTVGQPSRYEHTLWLYGNSGMQDPYTLDALTTASQLQKLLLAHGLSWRVVNYSAGGQSVLGELAWLRDTPVQRGDVVVFIDGEVERTDPAYYAKVVERAQCYAVSVNAVWFHFVQPTSEKALDRLSGPRLSVPLSGFVETVHMNTTGDTILAHELFAAITTF